MALRVGFLGVTHYHANFWARAFRQRENVSLVGLFDGDCPLAEAFAGEHDLEVWNDPAALVSACDAVAICSATADHRALAELAAQHGKAVLCEKPLATTMDDCLAIRETVARSGIRFMQSFPKRFDPINHEIAALLKDNAIGRLTLCRVRHGHGHGLTPDFHRAWFVDPARSGGGTLLDEGIHAADFLRWIVGEPQSVSAVVSSATLGLPVEDTAVATFNYESGLIAEMATGWGFAGADTSIEIYGTEGSVLLSGVDLASRPTREAGFLRTFRRETGGDGRWTASATVPHFKTGVFHEHVAFAFVDALAQGGPMPVTVDDGIRAFAMIEAAYRAAASGRREMIAWPDATA